MGTYRQMVALGSSFAAGPGLEPVADKRAGRSQRNYPHLLADALGADLVDATVSGATTATILDVPQRLRRHTFAPQIESVHPDADLVTVTAGGNDIGYIGSVVRTAMLNRLGRSRLTRPIVRRLRSAHPLTDVSVEQATAAADGLVRIVHEVRRRAPNARVVLVDYLPLFTDHAVPGDGVPFDGEQIAHFRRVAGTLTEVFADAGARSGAEVVHPGSLDRSHGLGTADPWMYGLRPIGNLVSSFHPTPSGMRAVAHLLFTTLAGEPIDGAPPRF